MPGEWHPSSVHVNMLLPFKHVYRPKVPPGTPTPFTVLQPAWTVSAAQDFGAGLRVKGLKLPKNDEV